MDYFSKAKTMNLPPLPWTWEALGEDKYCELAIELGFFNEIHRFCFAEIIGHIIAPTFEQLR